MTTQTKTRCITVFIIFAAAVLFAGACYRAEQTRMSTGLTASCFGGHCTSMFTTLR